MIRNNGFRISAFGQIAGAALAAGVLFAADASATVFPDGSLCFSGGLQTFTGPGADIINSGSFPQGGTSVNVQNQGLLIFRDSGSLQTTACEFLSLTDSGGVFFEDGTASTVHDGGWLSMNSNDRASITDNSSLTNNGFITQSSGTIEIESGSTLDGTGTTVVSGGAFHVNGLAVQSGVTITGGTLLGSGVVRSAVNNTGGTVGPGNSPGTLTVDGNYTQGPAGTLAMEIDSLLAFDVLDISGSATLDGILDLTVDAGYAATAQDGDTFTIIEWDSFSGAFATVNGLNFATDKFFTLDYGTNGLTLTVNAEQVAAVPEPGMIALFGLGLAGIAFSRRRRK